MEYNYYKFVIGDEEVMVMAYDTTEAFLKALQYAHEGDGVQGYGIVDDYYAETCGCDCI